MITEAAPRSIPCRGFLNIHPTFNMSGERALTISHHCLTNNLVSGAVRDKMERIVDLWGYVPEHADTLSALIQFDAKIP